MKNLRFIESIAPELISKDDPDASITKVISPEIIEKIHTIDNVSEVVRDPTLSSLLSKSEIPRPVVTFPKLFNGTFQFVQVTFNVPGSGASSVTTSDNLMAISYARSAIVPILQYANQYGFSTARVSNNLIQYSVSLTATNYNDNNLRTWVNQIIVDNNLPRNTCIIVLTPTSIRNTSADMVNALGYHSKANDPYIFCYVTGLNLTLEDRSDFYASILSHEIEETVVDPNADGSNPEVSDPCYNNCRNYWLSFFDNNNNYLRSSQSVPPASDLVYSYFINSVVSSRWARVSCPMGTPSETIPPEACSYRPPTKEEICQGLQDAIDGLTFDIDQLQIELENAETERIKQRIRQQIREYQQIQREYQRRYQVLGC